MPSMHVRTTTTAPPQSVLPVSAAVLPRQATERTPVFRKCGRYAPAAWSFIGPQLHAIPHVRPSSSPLPACRLPWSPTATGPSAAVQLPDRSNPPIAAAPIAAAAAPPLAAPQPPRLSASPPPPRSLRTCRSGPSPSWRTAAPARAAPHPAAHSTHVPNSQPTIPVRHPVCR